MIQSRNEKQDGNRMCSKWTHTRTSESRKQPRAAYQLFVNWKSKSKVYLLASCPSNLSKAINKVPLSYISFFFFFYVCVHFRGCVGVGGQKNNCVLLLLSMWRDHIDNKSKQMNSWLTGSIKIQKSSQRQNIWHDSHVGSYKIVQAAINIDVTTKKTIKRKLVVATLTFPS